MVINKFKLNPNQNEFLQNGHEQQGRNPRQCSLVGHGNMVTYPTEFSLNLGACEDIIKLQHVQNCPLLHSLHWLPINVRIRFKINVFTYKTLSERQPTLGFSHDMLRLQSHATAIGYTKLIIWSMFLYFL